MSFYITQDSQGNQLNLRKTDALIQDGALIVTGEEYIPNMICVIDNGMFEAAGYCYSEEEYQTLKSINKRKTWLVHPQAAEMSNYNI